MAGFFPYFSYRDAAAALDWLETTLDLEGYEWSFGSYSPD